MNQTKKSMTKMKNSKSKLFDEQDLDDSQFLDLCWTLQADWCLAIRNAIAEKAFDDWMNSRLAMEIEIGCLALDSRNFV